VSADTDHTPQDSSESTVPRRIDRRGALRLLGLTAVAAAPIPFLGRALDTALQLPVVEDPDAGAADEATQQRLRRWAMVIDLRYCDGCQSVGLPPQCTQACIGGHFVPQPMEWIEVFEDTLTTAEGGTFFQPTPCQQCQNPPCTNVCPVGATFATPEGVVMIDQDRCIGCRICMAACPYDRRFFNWGEPPVPVESALADYSPEHQVPARTGTVMKCDFCPEMARAGRLPYCAQACPNDAIYYGDLETGLATNGASVVDIYEFLERNNATRLKEDLGTEPRVHYIPGHGELVGRSPLDGGRLATTWPWQERAEAASWQR
jgi:molybdopterin-containing oxidoreductase family iron-sulfur binding subunit